MPKYFFSEDKNQKKDGFIFPNEAVERHLIRVLRASLGDVFIFCDGRKTDYICRISGLKPFCLEILEKKPCKNEAPIKIILYTGITKQNLMEFIAQKGTELGMTSLRPIITRYTNEKINIERLQKKALSGAEQSMRGIIPEIRESAPLSDAMKNADGFSVVLHEKNINSSIRLTEILKNINIKTRLNIWVGPPGGFSENEIELFKEKNYLITRMGNLILRTETAALCALSVIYNNLCI